MVVLGRKGGTDVYLTTYMVLRFQGEGRVVSVWTLHTSVLSISQHILGAQFESGKGMNGLHIVMEKLLYSNEEILTSVFPTLSSTVDLSLENSSLSSISLLVKQWVTLTPVLTAPTFRVCISVGTLGNNGELHGDWTSSPCVPEANS